MKTIIQAFCLVTMTTVVTVTAQTTTSPGQSATKDTVKSVETIAAFFKEQAFGTPVLPETVKTRSVQREFKSSKGLELRLAINFEFNSDALNSQSKQQLDNLAEVLKSPKFNQLKIELAGHTCDIGSTQYNMDLSSRRISSAVAYLIEQHGIARSRISSKPYGEKMPLIRNATTEKERAVNRRVVTYLPRNRGAIEDMLRGLTDHSPLKGFSWAVFRYGRGQKAELVKYDGSSVLHSSEEYRVMLRPALRKYVYIFQQDSHGNGQWLFPRRDLPWTNPLEPGEYWLPSASKVFVLDYNVGMETIYVVVTDEPATDLENVMDQHSANLFSRAIAQTIKTRGLKKIRIGPINKTQIGLAAVETNVIVISSGKPLATKDTDGLIVRKPQEHIANIMAQYSEFYMELKFEHK